jgi:anthranilate 1,2-dioxygenase small subunit
VPVKKQKRLAAPPGSVEAALIVRDLLDRYVSVVDARDMEGWADLFTDDASYCVYTRENHEAGLPIALIMDDSKDRILDRCTVVSEFWRGHYDFKYTRHTLSGLQLEDVSADGARFRCSVVVHACGLSSTPYVLAMGEYRDEVVFGRTPRFRAKEVILDNAILPGYFIVPL